MRIYNIESDLYVLIGEAYNSNTTLFIDGNDVLFVDAMASVEDSEQLKEFIEVELKKKVDFIICTHYFSDHLAALRLFPQAKIIAHKNYLYTFSSERYRSREEEEFFIEPDITISDGMTIKWGRYSLDIFYNPGHNMSTLNIDVPEADLIMVGDTVVGNIVYLYYTVPELFFPALNRLKGKSRSRLISGHGGVRKATAVENAITYLTNLQELVLNFRRSNSSIMDISLEECLSPGLQPTDFERMFHKRNLETIIERSFFSSYSYSI